MSQKERPLKEIPLANFLNFTARVWYVRSVRDFRLAFRSENRLLRVNKTGEMSSISRTFQWHVCHGSKGMASKRDNPYGHPHSMQLLFLHSVHHNHYLNTLIK